MVGGQECLRGQFVTVVTLTEDQLVMGAAFPNFFL